MKSITFLNRTGDITITWAEDSEFAVLAMVEKKMKEGYTFFIEKPVFLGLGTKTVKATSVHEVQKAGSAVLKTDAVNKLAQLIDDQDVAELVNQGKAQLTNPKKPSNSAEHQRARSASEVVQSNSTVAVRRIVGG